MVKKQIAKAIKDAIVTGLGVVDEQLVSARDRMEEAKRQTNESGEEAGSQGRFSALGKVSFNKIVMPTLLIPTADFQQECRRRTIESLHCPVEGRFGVEQVTVQGRPRQAPFYPRQHRSPCWMG